MVYLFTVFERDILTESQQLKNVKKVNENC